jgi:DNA-binding NarL/FixJ family response regulator
MITVGHVDDETLLRVGFAAWLRQAGDDIEVVGSAGSVAELRAALAAAPDVVVLDPVLRNGTTLQDNIRALHAWGARVVVTTNDTGTAGLRITAFQEDVAGFLEKGEDPRELLAAIRAAAQGRRYVTEHWTRFLVQGHVPLTPRQRDAVRCYSAGMTYAEGARRMNISYDGFKEHIEAARRRYRLAGRSAGTRAELRDQAERDGHLTEW